MCAILRKGHLYGLLVITALLILSIFPVSGFTQTRVVVVPLGGEETKFEPFAPFTRPSMGISDYTVNADTVFDPFSGLEWEREDTDIIHTWSSALDYCIGLQLGNKSDWRLPNLKELLSIVLYGNRLPAINYIAFPNTNSSAFWSATSAAPDNTKAWGVFFNDGRIDQVAKTTTTYVRCVRNHRPEGPLLRDNGDDTVTDLATDRVWQIQEDNTHKTWQEAVDYCKALTLGNKNDWRVPNVKELASIVDYRLYDPAFNKTLFSSAHHAGYWSTHPDAFYSPTYTHVWTVDFTDGGISSNNKSIRDHFVRCVRTN